MPLERCLNEIKSEGAIPAHTVLYELSNLTSDQVEQFGSTWSEVTPQRRLAIVDRLVSLAQDSAELDFSVVLRRCIEDEEEEVRRRAIEGLWEYEERQLIPVLCRTLQGDSSTKVRATAAMGLGKFASLAEEGKLLRRDGQRIQECLMKSLVNQKEEMEVRRRALESVAVFSANGIADHIKKAYNSSSLELRCSAIYAMGKTGEPLWLSILVKELKSSTAALRYEASSACGELGEEDAIPHLIPLIGDDDLQVQLAAIRAIGSIGGPLAKKALRRCLKSGDPAVEDAAREYLEMAETMEDPLGFKY
ncbi:MAG: HEAT repeat domain-containing protein [SAR202 cluster bacterium]|nr:HEAT repeat domain-containing protein [SAR202 cluster bacterium]